MRMMSNRMGDFFGGIGSALFGEEEQPPQLNLERGVELLTPQERALQNLLIQTLTGRVQAGEPTLSPLETTSLAGLEQIALDLISGETLGRFAEEVLRDVATQGSQDFEEFFQTTVQQPALREFERDIIPTIRKRFAPQFFGGERREAEARATEDLLRQLTQARAGLAFQTEKSQIENVLSALSMIPALSSIDEEQLLGLLSAGTGTRQAQASLRSLPIQLATGVLGQPTIENIGFVDPGRAREPSIFESFLRNVTGGASGAFGRRLGRRAGKAAADITF